MKAKSVYGLITPNHYLYLGLREAFYDSIFIKIESQTTLCKCIFDDLTVFIDDSVFETDFWPEYKKVLKDRKITIIWLKDHPGTIYNIEMTGDLRVNKNDDILKLKYIFSLIRKKKHSSCYNSSELNHMQKELFPLFLLEGNISAISHLTSLKSKTLYYHRNQIARKFGFSCFSKLRSVYIKHNVIANL